MTDHAPPSAELLLEYVDDLFTVLSSSDKRADMRSVLRQWILEKSCERKWTVAPLAQPADDEAAIERVAKAIRSSAVHNNSEWEECSDAVKNEYRNDARAAYAALRGGT